MRHWFTPRQHPEAHIQEVNQEGVSYLSVDEFERPEEVTQNYEEWDELPLEIRSQLRGKKYYMLTFNDERLFMEAIRLMLSRLTAHLDNMWLDNDYGALMPARTFMEESARNPGWDWRRFQLPPP